MQQRPILVIMAAGMGSRYGGLKQMDPVGAHGEFMLDYSLYDAKRAGFERAVLVIKRETEPDFRRIPAVARPVSRVVCLSGADGPARGLCLAPQAREAVGHGARGIRRARKLSGRAVLRDQRRRFLRREAFRTGGEASANRGRRR